MRQNKSGLNKIDVKLQRDPGQVWFLIVLKTLVPFIFLFYCDMFSHIHFVVPNGS
jgi:hypothetical protein